MLRVILDTNIIVSGLISEHGAPAKLLDAAIDRLYALVTSSEQLAEIGDVTRRPTVKPLVTPATVGRFVNDLQRIGLMLKRLPRVQRSPDPADDYLLAMAEAAAADYLVTGDKRDLLALGAHGGTSIVTARAMLKVLKIAE